MNPEIFYLDDFCTHNRSPALKHGDTFQIVFLLCALTHSFMIVRTDDHPPVPSGDSDHRQTELISAFKTSAFKTRIISRADISGLSVFVAPRNQ